MSTLFERMSAIARQAAEGKPMEPATGKIVQRGARTGPKPADEADVQTCANSQTDPKSLSHQPGITDREARVKERALERFKFWLLDDRRTLADLQGAVVDDLVAQYRPLEPDDIEQMIAVRSKTLRVRERRADPNPPPEDNPRSTKRRAVRP